MSTRREVIEAVADAWRKQGGGRYYVRRGPIDWLAWDWNARPYAVAIVVDASTLPLPRGLSKDDDLLRTLRLGFEVMARMPSNGATAEPEPSEAEQEVMVLHVATVIHNLFQRNASNGGSLLDGIENPPDALTDWRDVALGVQGIVATVPFKYTES